MALGHDLGVPIAFLEPLQDNGASKDRELEVKAYDPRSLLIFLALHVLTSDSVIKLDKECGCAFFTGCLM